jgi:hypothetical protein
LHDFVFCAEFYGDYSFLISFFQKFGSSPETNWIFLEDYGDGGNHSIQIMIHLFYLTNLFQQNVKILI